MAPTYIVQDGSGQANGKDSQVHQALYATPVSEPGVGYMTNVDRIPIIFGQEAHRVSL